MRTCRTCHETKSLEDFDVRADTGGRRTVCKECRRRRQRRPTLASATAVSADQQKRRTNWLVGAAELLPCRLCGELKPWTEFPRRGRDSDRLQTWCKTCFAKYKAERHQRNHEREMRRIMANTTRTRADSRARVRAYLREHPCIDCGEQDIVVLEFDHVRGTKRLDISKMVTDGYPWSTIEAEIAKCDVRCANCHRKVTELRRRTGAMILAVKVNSPRPGRDSNSRPLAS
jgi:hypothetical protein